MLPSRVVCARDDLIEQLLAAPGTSCQYVCVSVWVAVVLYVSSQHNARELVTE